MTIREYLSSKRYPGRFLLAGVSSKGEEVLAYAIMGRSENSRNRIFTRAYVEKVVSLIRERATFTADFWDIAPYLFIAPASYAEKDVAKFWKAENYTPAFQVADFICGFDGGNGPAGPEFTKEQIEGPMEDFIRWSLRYDLWCKMEFFGADIEEAMSQEAAGREEHKRRGRMNLLELLPETFTLEDTVRVRQSMGMDAEGTGNMLSQWAHRHYITKMTIDNKLLFKKTEKWK